MEFCETGSSIFALSSFPWRDVAVPGLPGWRGLSGATSAVEEEERRFAGAFSYSSGDTNSSLCRNRFLLWESRGRYLYLLEVSLDCSLARAALRLEVQDGSTLLPRVTIQELERGSVAVLFATTSCVFRLLLPHPDTISKNPVLSSAGGGLLPSVFASVKAGSLQGSNMASLFSDHSSARAVSSVSGCISPAGHTTFSLASSSGSIYLIHLPPPHERGLPVRMELRQFSVTMNKLWAAVVPSAFRGAGEVEDAPVSVAMQSFGGNMVVLALCRDIHLRLWATEPADCIMTCNLEEYLLQNTESDPSISGVNLCLRKAAASSSTSLRFAVYIETLGGAQVSVFQLLVVDRQLHLEHIASFPCINERNLVDMCCTDSEVWAIWRSGDGDECVKHLTYDGELWHTWQEASLSPLPPQEVSVSPTAEPRSVFLDALFHPGRFCTSTINKALELYGSKSDGVSVRQLREIATATIEHELRSSADATHLHHEQFRELQIKCWTKFYSCCCQYQQLMSQLVGLFQDPATGMVCLFKEEMVSFVHPVSPVDCLSFEPLQEVSLPGDVSEDDIHRFLEAARLTRTQLSGEALESLLDSEEPVILAYEMAEAIADIPPRENMSYLEKIESLLLPIASVQKVAVALVKALDPSSEHDVMDATEESESRDPDLQLAMSQLFASPMSERLLANIVRERCSARLTLARDTLLLLSLLRHQGKVRNVNKYVYKVSGLLQNYHNLHWLSCQSVVPASPLSLESNLRQLAALNISTTSRQSSLNCECGLLELYLRGNGGQELRTDLVRSVAAHAGLNSIWTDLLPQTITILLRQLWPATRSVTVCQFLLSACQHTHLQDYVAGTAGIISEGKDSLSFLLAQSFLTTGEVEKATKCFLAAVSYPGYSSEPLLQQVVSSGEEGEERDGGDRGRLLKYFLKVIGLFEQASCHLAVIKIAKTAVLCFERGDLQSAVLWSILFKYHLHLGYYEDAYMDMMNNPDLTRRRECLHHFVVVLSEHNQLKLLCHLDYPGMEEEIVRVMEDRARSMDLLKHKYYDLLYCYHTTKHNYRKAASVMYEYGLRLGREAPGMLSLKKQANCYCMCLTALHLAQPQYAWVVVPVELEEIMEKNTRKAQNRKRPHPSEGSQREVQVEVRTVSDIDRDYALVRTKLSLLKRDPSMATQIYSPFVSPEEVVARLIQVGLFDKAVDTALCFELPLDSIFEALASRCVHLTTNMMAFRDETEDASTWNWLGANESIDIPTPTEKSVVDKAWLMLKSYLETYDPLHNHTLQKCVVKKLLSLGSHLPEWLVQSFKETNPAELLRLYLVFDQLEEATLFALSYIDAVLGPRKEEFSLQTTLHASSPSVWLPYSSLDHLRVALQRDVTNTNLQELSSQLLGKLREYFRTTASVTADMEHQARTNTH